MRQLLAITVLLLGSISMAAQTKNNEMKYNKIQVEDCNVFYREAGSPEKLPFSYCTVSPAAVTCSAN